MFIQQTQIPTDDLNEWFFICATYDPTIDEEGSFDDEDFNDNCQVNYNKLNKYSALVEKHKLEDKIIRFKRNHLTVALDSDGTRWRQAKYKIYFFAKTMMKYPDEFIDSISNIKEKYGFIRLVLTRPVLTFNYLYLLLRRLLGKIKSAIL